jgi:hypothetical protein
MEQLDDKTYSLCEAVADIAFIAGEKKYYNGNSRQDIEDIIHWAIEFEEMYKNIEWGVESSPDYIETITSFAETKIVDNDKSNNR